MLIISAARGHHPFCKQIIVLENGEIVGVHTPRALHSCDVYREIALSNFRRMSLRRNFNLTRAGAKAKDFAQNAYNLLRYLQPYQVKIITVVFLLPYRPFSPFIGPKLLAM